MTREEMTEEEINKKAEKRKTSNKLYISLLDVFTITKF